jgi:hypothetical protein
MTTINGKVIAVTRLTESSVIANDLRRSAIAIAASLSLSASYNETTVVDQIALHVINIDDVVVDALVDLLKSKQQQTKPSLTADPSLSSSSGGRPLWDKLTFSNCTGDVGGAILKCTGLNIQMKGLKKLSLWGNKITETGANHLLNGLTKNNELHTLNLFRRFKCSHQIQHFTTMNQGGRKLLESKNSIPVGLWPSVLERANRMKLIQRKEDLATQEERRAEMIFGLLKGLGPWNKVP